MLWTLAPADRLILSPKRHDTQMFRWCPYCHKIVLQLEEKRIPYVVEKINMRCYGDKPAEFLAKVPSGLLPVLEVDGRVITESATIQQVLVLG